MAVAGAAAAAAVCVAVSANDLKAVLSNTDDKAYEDGEMVELTELTEDGEMVDIRFGRLVCIITSTAKFFNVKKTKIFR